MKKTLLCAYLGLLACFLLLLVPAPGPEAAPEPTPTGAASPAETSPAPPLPASETVALLLPDGTVEERALEDYLLGVLAAEMPADFPMEALKAQAVAARTYALYCADGDKHSAADLCTDPGCCQAYQDEAARRDKWGADYDRCEARIARAAAETAGQILLYEGRAVFAAFHSSSAGATEDCGEVWNPRPYLVSVSSPETAETVPNFISTLRCAPLDFRDALLSLHPEADFSGAEEEWLGELTRDQSGRVASCVLGGVAFKGTALRSLFSLRSTAFTLEYEDGAFVFTAAGYGHGVGMSQNGAKLMAESGADYRAILAHNYPGTELGEIRMNTED